MRHARFVRVEIHMYIYGIMGGPIPDALGCKRLPRGPPGGRPQASDGAEPREAVRRVRRRRLLTGLY